MSSVTEIATRTEVGTRDRLIVSAECVVSLVLGFVTLGSKSLWNDEAYSATVASGSWRSLYSSWRDWDANMSLYHVVLHLWRGFGDGDAWLRSLSVLAIAATVPVVFMIGRRLFTTTVGLLAGLVFAVAPFGVQWSQEVRSYAMLVLLVSLSMYLFVVGVETGRRRALTGFVLVSVLAVYAHFFAVLVLVAQAASLLFLPRELRRTRQLIASGAAIAILLVPGAVLAATGRPDQLSWLQRPGLQAAIGQPTHLVGGSALAIIFLPLFVVAAAFGWRVWTAHRSSVESFRVAVVGSWLVVPYAISLAFSVLVKPAYLDRFLLVSLPAVSLVVAVGLGQLPKAWAAAGAVLITAVSLAGVVSWYREPPQDWRGAVAYVLERSDQSDGIVFCDHRTGFEYYVLQRDRSASAAPTPLVPSDPWQVGFHGSSYDAPDASPRRVWVVGERDDNGEKRCVRRNGLGGRTRAAHSEFDSVRVTAYDE